MKKCFLLSFIFYTLSVADVFAQVSDTLEMSTSYSSYNPTIYFNKNSAELTPRNGESLRGLLAYARFYQNNPRKGSLIEIYGNSDGLGKERNIKRLSKNRAKVVAKYLIAKGIDKKILVVNGYGCQRPALPDDIDNKGKNRYVSCELVRKK